MLIMETSLTIYFTILLLNFPQNFIKQKNKGQEKGKNEKTHKSKSRNRNSEKESVRAKLAFFRNRVANRDKEQGDVERRHQRSERQR